MILLFLLVLRCYGLIGVADVVVGIVDVVVKVVRVPSVLTFPEL